MNSFSCSSAGHDGRGLGPAALRAGGLVSVAPQQPNPALQQQCRLQSVDRPALAERQQFPAGVPRAGRPAHFQHDHKRRPQSLEQRQLSFPNGITELVVREQ